jgi:hypothetical protein
LSSSICDPSTPTNNLNFLVQWSDEDSKIFLHSPEYDVFEVHDTYFEILFFSKFFNISLALVVEDFNVLDSPNFPSTQMLL